ncbi:hypothetical protein G7Y89_g10164 [Cudoniella acicularis]|uniref:AB hydrolase-1 domain-containing protein n=1 Tax=Cudoniella acicularis TaxID=354080 RepID=A0A8H4VZ06_9HELO|nr:hypothetical protein G7Y89_g10164 [Cudoniella acicularis]
MATAPSPTTTITKPTILIIQGSFHTPLAYSSLKDTLTSLGHPVVHPILPSCSNTSSPKFPETTLADDANTIHLTLKNLIENLHQPIVVAMHSYGGLVGSNAIPPSLTFSHRKSLGLPGGVIHLFFFSAFLMPAGKSILQAFGEGPNSDVHADERMYFRDGAKTLYNDLEEEEAKLWEGRLVPCSWRVQETVLTGEAWRDVKSTYLVCEGDKAAPVSYQESFAALAGSKVIRCSAGHCPMLSQTQMLAESISEAAMEAIKDLEESGNVAYIPVNNLQLTVGKLIVREIAESICPDMRDGGIIHFHAHFSDRNSNVPFEIHCASYQRYFILLYESCELYFNNFNLFAHNAVIRMTMRMALIHRTHPVGQRHEVIKFGRAMIQPYILIIFNSFEKFYQGTALGPTSPLHCPLTLTPSLALSISIFPLSPTFPLALLQTHLQTLHAIPTPKLASIVGGAIMKPTPLPITPAPRAATTVPAIAYRAYLTTRQNIKTPRKWRERRNAWYVLNHATSPVNRAEGQRSVEYGRLFQACSDNQRVPEWRPKGALKLHGGPALKLLQTAMLILTLWSDGTK